MVKTKKEEGSSLNKPFKKKTKKDQLVRCPNCGSLVKQSKKFCSDCGSSLEAW